MNSNSWGTENFEEMSWHDNYIHGIELVEGEYGAGQLIIDIDYILEWKKSEDSKFNFVIAPAELIFNDVIDLVVSINYRSATAAMGPFSIDGINRRSEKRERYTATIWTIPINFPNGEIEFQSSGFTQSLKSAPSTYDKQWLTENERKSA